MTARLQLNDCSIGRFVTFSSAIAFTFVSSFAWSQDAGLPGPAGVPNEIQVFTPAEPNQAQDLLEEENECHALRDDVSDLKSDLSAFDLTQFEKRLFAKIFNLISANQKANANPTWSCAIAKMFYGEGNNKNKAQTEAMKECVKASFTNQPCAEQEMVCRSSEEDRRDAMKNAGESDAIPEELVRDFAGDALPTESD